MSSYVYVFFFFYIEPITKRQDEGYDDRGRSCLLFSLGNFTSKQSRLEGHGVSFVSVFFFVGRVLRGTNAVKVVSFTDGKP